MEKEENVNVKLEDDFKPRKWLLFLLIVLGGAIFGVLVYYGINDYKEYRKNHPSTFNQMEEKQNEFNEEFNKTKETVEKAHNQVEVDSFNGILEMYDGTKYGNQVVNLLDEVIESNKKNADHLITVTRNGQSSSDTEVIRSFKTSLEDWTKYEVIFDYDKDGYVNKIEVR